MIGFHGRPDKNSSEPRTNFRATIESYGLKRDMAYRWIAMSYAPTEVLPGVLLTPHRAVRPLKSTPRRHSYKTEAVPWGL